MYKYAVCGMCGVCEYRCGGYVICVGVCLEHVCLYRCVWYAAWGSGDVCVVCGCMMCAGCAVDVWCVWRGCAPCGCSVCLVG